MKTWLIRHEITMKSEGDGDSMSTCTVRLKSRQALQQLAGHIDVAWEAPSVNNDVTNGCCWRPAS